MLASHVLHIAHRFQPMKSRVIIMRRITVMGAALALLAGVVTADAQGIGYGPGVNPSNPQDMTFRSNPQDLTAPGGSNRQDLVRRPSGVSTPGLTSSPSRTYAQPHAVKTKAKQKARSRSSTARR